MFRIANLKVGDHLSNFSESPTLKLAILNIFSTFQKSWKDVQNRQPQSWRSSFQLFRIANFEVGYSEHLSNFSEKLERCSESPTSKLAIIFPTFQNRQL